MALSTHRTVDVFRMPRLAFWAAIIMGLLLQRFLPLTVPLAQLFDFPLIITIYFAVMRRDKIYGVGLGTVLGLLQDALSRGHIGMFGMCKALVGYLAAAASIKFNVELLLSRLFLAGVMVVVHSIVLTMLERLLLEPPPKLDLMEKASGVLLNAALALVVFLILDRFRRPAD